MPMALESMLLIAHDDDPRSLAVPAIGTRVPSAVGGPLDRSGVDQGRCVDYALQLDPYLLCRSGFGAAV